MKSISKGKLIAIRGVLRVCCNNGLSTSFGKPYGPGFKAGRKVKTPMMIDCLDNRRRRVYGNITNFGYELYVNMGREKLVLCHPRLLTPVGYGFVSDLIKEA